jgi:hypothetical protein
MAPITVEHFPAGTEVDFGTLSTGDIVLTHSGSLVSKLIRVGQAFRFPKRYASWSHCALVLNSNGDIAEAVSKGVMQAHISHYADKEYTVVRTGVDEHDQKQVLHFAYSVLQARWRYGYVTFMGLVPTLLFGSKIVFGYVGTAICSGFVGDALTRAGFVWPVPAQACMPAHFAQEFNAPAWDSL